VTEKVISYIASLSYPAFLIHSATIEGVLLFLAPDSWLMFWLVYAMIVIAILIQAALLKWIDGKITIALNGGLKI
jgi:peptidoglycan/LPS O-acetylase OafA/YrhL